MSVSTPNDSMETFRLYAACDISGIPILRKSEIAIIDEAIRQSGGSYDLNVIRRYLEDIALSFKVNGIDMNKMTASNVEALYNDSPLSESEKNELRAKRPDYWETIKRLMNSGNDYLRGLLSQYQELKRKADELKGYDEYSLIRMSVEAEHKQADKK